MSEAKERIVKAVDSVPPKYGNRPIIVRRDDVIALLNDNERLRKAYSERTGDYMLVKGELDRLLGRDDANEQIAT